MAPEVVALQLAFALTFAAWVMWIAPDQYEDDEET